MRSRSLNKVMLIGNVGVEPKATSTSTGVLVCTFIVATDRSWLPRGATERRKETQWHRVVAFDKLAKVCSQILKKGTKVFVSGYVQSKKMVNPKGKKFRKTEIVASKVITFKKNEE